MSTQGIWRAVAVVAVLGVLLGGALFMRGRAPVPANADVRTGGSADAVVLLKGVHTVRHSTAPLPTADRARADGRPMLVWFSATWCTTCSSMESYAYDAIGSFDGRLAFAEKSIDEDRSAATRYAVRGTPTFVLIDARGDEIGQFFYQPDGQNLRNTIEANLKKRGL